MLKNNLKIAWRFLIRNKAYSLLNISGMAIGLAAFWLIALYVGNEMSYDRFFTNADNIYRVTQHASWETGSIDVPINPPPLGPELAETFPEVKQSVRIDAEGAGTIKFKEKVIKQDDIFYVDKAFFKVFDYRFIEGDANTALSEPNTIVITESLAKKIFGNASSALNQTITLDRDASKVTGVIQDVPQNTHLQFSGVRSMYVVPNEQNVWKNFNLYTYISLKKGTDIKAFEKKINAFGMLTIAKEMGVTNYHMELQPLTSIHLHSHLQFEIGANSSMSRIYIFIAIGILILLIALINYMNLFTARSVERVKEIGIRKVIGSSYRDLAGLFFAESLLVTFIAAICAVFLVELSMPLFREVSGRDLNIWHFGAFYTITFITLFTLLAGIISGSYPVLFLSRFKLIPSLKGQLGNMQKSILLRKSLVVFQFVIVVFLISGSFIIYKQMQYVNNTDLGFNKAQVVTFHIDDTKVREQIPALKTALLQSPLIESVGVAGNVIGSNYIGGHDFTFEKNGVMQTSSPILTKQLFIGDDFLKTMNIQLLQGRGFLKDMKTDEKSAMIINETLMKQLGYKNAIGKKSEYQANQDVEMSHRTIVGVVKDFHYSSLQNKIEPMVLMLPPAMNEQDNLYVRIKKGKIPEGLDYLKKSYAKFDSENAADFNFLDDLFSKQYSAEQKQEQLSHIFTVIAFIIACLGLTGLVMFTISQRVKEIGIRKVLGANALSISVMLGKSFIQLILIASIIAIPISWWAMSKWLQDFAYRTHLQWWIFAIAGLITIFISMLTISLQAVKAARANPVDSLRSND